MKNLNKVMMAGLIAGITLLPAVSIGQIGNLKVKIQSTVVVENYGNYNRNDYWNHLR
ncbi:MAG: hypothetical protein IPG07_17110 [Crocinitomicaceae bacterium]|nr:hypothetical protein [Crocinitomicaceae bacterium]